MIDDALFVSDLMKELPSEKIDEKRVHNNRLSFRLRAISIFKALINKINNR